MTLTYLSSRIALISITLLLSSFVTTCASNPLDNKSFFEKVVSYCAQSPIIERYNTFMAPGEYYQNAPLASDDIQQRGQKSQDAVGIKKTKQALIKNVKDLGEFSASFKHIFLDEESIAQTYLSPASDQLNKNKDLSAYGILNCNLHHESVHIKYNDHACSSFMRVAAIALSLSFTPVLIKVIINPQGLSKIAYPFATLLTIASGHALSVKYNNYKERRADIEGHYATQCHMCVSEKAMELRTVLSLAHEAIPRCQQALKDLDPQNSSQQDAYQQATSALTASQGWIAHKAHYLSAKENDIIAAHLKKEGKVCDYHHTATVAAEQKN